MVPWFGLGLSSWIFAGAMPSWTGTGFRFMSYFFLRLSTFLSFISSFFFASINLFFLFFVRISHDGEHTLHARTNTTLRQTPRLHRKLEPGSIIWLAERDDTRDIKRGLISNLSYGHPSKDRVLFQICLCGEKK